MSGQKSSLSLTRLQNDSLSGFSQAWNPPLAGTIVLLLNSLPLLEMLVFLLQWLMKNSSTFSQFDFLDPVQNLGLKNPNGEDYTLKEAVTPQQLKTI